MHRRTRKKDPDLRQPTAGLAVVPAPPVSRKGRTGWNATTDSVAESRTSDWLVRVKSSRLRQGSRDEGASERQPATRVTGRDES